MNERARAVAATVLAEEVRRRAVAPGDTANIVTWGDLGRVLESLERVAESAAPAITDQIEAALAILPLILAVSPPPETDQ